MVARAVDPAGEPGLRAGMLDSELPTGMRAILMHGGPSFGGGSGVRRKGHKFARLVKGIPAFPVARRIVARGRPEIPRRPFRTLPNACM